ncbi:KAP family P-loop NTPase fold protein [Vibrio coralliirubri]|uniref:KAP family P-loop NTPase fold protein n=1 Tax=Vibrio coralliirubri TaxID=1516159 RepID=UPI0018D02C8B|nr:P-loop NTPase fold protein [Vibrio coralliirubri]
MNHASRYDEWKDKYNWSTCITDREEYGKFLLSVLTSEKDGFVLNLNGSWGTGKTEFLRRLYVELAEQSHPVVYIDAWESDFLKDPLTVICTELLNQLGFMFKNCKADKRFKNYQSCIDHLNGLMINFNKLSEMMQAAGQSYSQFTGEQTDFTHIKLFEQVIGVAGPKVASMKGVDSTNQSLLAKLVSQQNDLKDSMESIRHQIKTISGIMSDLYDLEAPIVVLLDELDRCRPDYAIKMLEIIKHFFNVEGCAFLIATDTKSLESSIKAVYGAEFESERYLRRFFNQRITLKKPSIFEYVSAKALDLTIYEEKGVSIFPFGSDKDENNLLASRILDLSSIELRDVEQILKKFMSSLDYIVKYKPKSLSCINIAVLLFGIVEHHIGSEHFESRTNRYSSIDSEWGRVLFYSDVNMVALMKLQLSTVSECYSRFEFKSHGRTQFGQDQLMLTFFSNDPEQYRQPSWMKFKLLERASEQAQKHKANSKSYWLWEDYKNIIGLAANIE